MRIGRNPTLTALLVAVTLFLALNLAARSTLSRTRLDLTESHLHALSRGTENILGNLPVPVELQLFWTPGAGREIPALKLWLLPLRPGMAARGTVDFDPVVPRTKSEGHGPAPTGGPGDTGKVGDGETGAERKIPCQVDKFLGRWRSI